MTSAQGHTFSGWLVSKRFGVYCILAVILLASIHSVVSFHVISQSELVRGPDEAGYISGGLFVSDLLRQHNYGALARYASTLSYHPRFCTLFQGIVFRILALASIKDISLMIVVFNGVVFLLLAFAVMKLGSIGYDPFVGLLAATILSCAPLLVGQSRTALADYPLTCAVTLFFMVLLKTDSFKSAGLSLAAGILFVAVQLTKESGVLYVLGPLAYYIVHALVTKKGRRVRVYNIVSMLAVIGLSLGTMYALPWNHEAAGMLVHKSMVIHNNEYVRFYYFMKYPLWYWGTILSFALLPFMLMFLLRIRRENILFLIWFCVPFIIFSLSTNRAVRYLMPVLPACAILCAAEIRRLSKRWKVIYWFASVIVLSAFIQYVNTTFFSTLENYNPLAEQGLTSVYHDERMPTVRTLFNFFIHEKLQTEQPVRILFTFNNGVHSTLQNELLTRDIAVEMDCPQTADEFHSPEPGSVNWYNYVLDADYVIDKKGDVGDPGIFEDIAGALQKGLSMHADSFELCRRDVAHDGEELFIYKKKI